MQRRAVPQVTTACVVRDAVDVIGRRQAQRVRQRRPERQARHPAVDGVLRRRAVRHVYRDERIRFAAGVPPSGGKDGHEVRSSWASNFVLHCT